MESRRFVVARKSRTPREWRAIGARKRTRTSTPLRELRPERSASANSAIRAQASFYIAGFLSATNPASGYW